MCTISMYRISEIDLHEISVCTDGILFVYIMQKSFKNYVEKFI